MKRTRTLLFTGDKTTKIAVKNSKLSQKKQNIPKNSQEKRHLLIENAFKRIYKRIREPVCLKNRELICVIMTKSALNFWLPTLTYMLISKLTQVFMFF